jgi:hypothetical protein
MSQKLFLNTGLETIKGGALHALKDAGNAGAYDFAYFDFSGIAVDQERFKLGGDVYEIHSILTDTGSESTVAVGESDTSITFDVAPTIPLVPGAVIRMEDEYMIVIDYNVNGPSVNVVRGAFGSTAAAHSIANSDTFQAAQAVKAGAFACPIDDTAAAATVIDVAAAVDFWNTGYSSGLGGGIGVRVENSLKVDAFSGPADSVVFAYPADGGVAPNSDGTDSVTVNFTDGGAGEDYMTRTDGGSFLDDGVVVGEDITIGSAVANDGTYTVNSVSDDVIYVDTASWTDEAQADAITVAQEFAQTNATLTAFGGGVEPAGQAYVKLFRKATAGDVSAGSINFVAPWAVDEAYAFVADATGVQLAWDGTVVVTGRYVAVNNGGATDWEAGDVIELTIVAA